MDYFIYHQWCFSKPNSEQS